MEKNLRGFKDLRKDEKNSLIKNIVDISFVIFGIIGIATGFLLNAITITIIRLNGSDITIKSPFMIISFISIFFVIIGIIFIMQNNESSC